MRKLLPLVFAPWLGCSHDDTPAWAFDPIWIEPLDGGIHGIHTWELFSERWHESRDDKHYVCSVIVELWGTPSDACPDCMVAWDVQSEVLETDCDPAVADEPQLVALPGVGIGDLTADPEAPYPSSTYTGYVDYGSGTWEVHGWAYPEALDLGTQPTSNAWDDEQPFQLWPTLDWPWPPG